MSIGYVQTNTFYLAGSGVIIGATSITLTSLTDIYGNILTMSSFGVKGYITLEPDTNNEEAATFTGITANTNGTYTLTGVKTVLAQTPYTESSGLVRQHAGGTKVVVTDNVAFWNTFPNKANNETITGTWGSPSVPTNPNDYTNKNYVDGLVIAGGVDASSTAKGITKLSINPVSSTNPIAVGDNDTRVPTQTEANALAGTSGTPSTTNKYVTENDTTNYATITATTISFTGPATIADSGSGFVTAGFRVGDSIIITGSASNNGTFTVLTVAAGSMTVVETIVNEVAGASDTISSAIISKLVRTNPTTGLIPATLIPPTVSPNISILAGETITAGQPVYTGYYDAVQVAFDAKDSAASGWSTASTSISKPLTIGNNTNRYLIVCISVGLGNGSPGNLTGVTGVSFAGNAMTLLQSNTTTGFYDLLYGIASPTVGTSNLTFTITASSGGSNGDYAVSTYSYYNCNSSPSFSGKNTSGSPSVGVVASNGAYNNTLAFIASNINGASGSWTSTPLTSQTQLAHNGAVYLYGGSTGTIDIDGTENISFTPTVNLSSCDTVFYISLASSTAPTAGYAKLTSTASAGYPSRYSKFLGFALTGGTATQNITVTTNGNILGLSSLELNSFYYLADTYGTISTTPGTVIKKVGLSTSTTSLVIREQPKLGTTIVGGITTGTVYLAGYDLFLLVSNATGTTSITSDSSSTPTTIILERSGTGSSSMTCPIKSGNYYKITTNGTYTVDTIPLN